MARNNNSNRTVNYHRNRQQVQQERPSNASIALVTIVIVSLIAIFVANFFFVGDHNEKSFEGETSHVKWEYVNLRQDHNIGSEAIDQLHMGDQVELTSRVFEAWDTEWIYVRSEKGNGWVVTASLYQPAE